MRTRTLLCLAALTAAGVATSMAQSSNVYSLNIVGYANVQIVGNNGLYSNPFNVVKNGVTNSANDVLSCIAPLDPSGLSPGLDLFFYSTWNGGGFDTVYYEQDYCVGGSPPTPTATNGWVNPANGLPVPPPTITPGTAFFINNGSPPITNTFAGEVTPLPGKTNNVLIGANNVMLGSACPFSGNQTGTQNIWQLPLAPLDPSGLSPGLDLFFFSTWNGGGYDTLYYEQDYCVGGSPPTPGATNGWVDPATGLNHAPPKMVIGQGFFINNGSPPIVWSQTLTNAP